ncbi:MAG: hypothetical protein HUK07_03295, partial [Bacteroidaceae bacterium]|nr:hypothetical protein [Bacteroidaceae bacterium]
MKHIFSFFLLVALLTSCTAEAQKINVEVITDAKSTKAFVIDTEKPNEPIMTVDVSDSICSFELPAKEGQFLLVATDGGYQQMFFNDGEKVSVDVVKDVVKGTGLNEKWGNFLVEKEKLKDDPTAFGELLKKVCKENEDNDLPVAAIMMSMEGGNLSIIAELLKSDAAYAKHPLLAELAQITQSMQLRMPGTSLKDFSIPDADGKVHKMSEYIGKSKYVLVD